MSVLLRSILHPYMSPDEAAGGGFVDKGDDFVPTGSDAPTQAAEDIAAEAPGGEDDDLDPEDPDGETKAADPAEKAPKKDLHQTFVIGIDLLGRCNFSGH